MNDSPPPKAGGLHGVAAAIREFHGNRSKRLFGMGLSALTRKFEEDEQRNLHDIYEGWIDVVLSSEISAGEFAGILHWEYASHCNERGLAVSGDDKCWQLTKVEDKLFQLRGQPIGEVLSGTLATIILRNENDDMYFVDKFEELIVNISDPEISTTLHGDWYELNPE